MKIVKTKLDLRRTIEGLLANDKKLKTALIPTMGALHNGHLSLVETAKKNADIIIASIFVNPTQFGKNEDFKEYPKQEKNDCKLLEESGVDIVYIPDVEEIYPEGFSTNITIARNTDILCGRYRKGHFDGVTTIVAKLLNQCQPDIAIFGKKDYQQLIIIKQLVADFDMNVEIIGSPIIREDSGLAMSSRNEYLSKNERDNIAPELYKTLQAMKENFNNGTSNVCDLTEWAKEHLIKSGFDKVQYIEIYDAVTLKKVSSNGSNFIRIFTAAYIGNTRLIDNILI